MIDPAKREEIKKRVAKLLEITTERGASENEEAFASKKAAQLMAEYSISIAETITKDTKTKLGFRPLKKFHKAVLGIHASTYIARLNDCKVWLDYKGESVQFLGLPEDVEMSEYLLDLITNNMVSSCEGFKKSANFKYLQKELKKSALTLTYSFFYGMEEQICFRLDLLYKEKEKQVQAAMSQSKALVVIKKDLVEKEFSDMGLKLQPQSKKRSIRSKEAMQEGHKAGEKVNLSSGIESGKSKTAITN